MTARRPIDFSRIAQAVHDALLHEERTSGLRNALELVYAGSPGNAAQHFMQMRTAIAVIPEQLALAARLGVGPTAWKHVRRVLLDIVAYWDAPHPKTLPDHSGLIGSIDAAIMTHRRLSELHQWLLETEGVDVWSRAGLSNLDLLRPLLDGLEVLARANDQGEHGLGAAPPARMSNRNNLSPAPGSVFRGELTQPKPAPAAAPDGGPRLYEVWFGTNRTLLDPRDPSGGFSGMRDDHVHYGVCEVAIPRSHKFGSVGTAWWRRWLRLEFADDHIKVVRRRAIDDAASFFDDLREELASSQGKQLLFYLHGYNVSFDEAAIRAAQLFADLKVPGAAAFFSWPSKASVDDYFADVERIAESEADIAAFLTGLATQLGGATVHIIAHSMGNRGLARAVQRIAAAAAGTAGVRFGQIILAAPDISVGLFHDLARVYPTLSARTTMYVSARDRALGLSKWLQDAPRAGFTPPITIVPNIDTIEVTNIDVSLLGHGYYADAEAVLYDIASLLHTNIAPEQRTRLRASQVTGSPGYWVIDA